MCCTKYGEDGQSALILDKQKKKPEMKPGFRNKNEIINQTTMGERADNQFVLPSSSMNLGGDGNSRNHQGVNLSMSGSALGAPQNTKMFEQQDQLGRSNDGVSQQTFGMNERSFRSQRSRMSIGKESNFVNSTVTPPTPPTEDSSEKALEISPLSIYRQELTIRMKEKLLLLPGKDTRDFGTSSDRKQLLT